MKARVCDHALGIQLDVILAWPSMRVTGLMVIVDVGIELSSQP